MKNYSIAPSLLAANVAKLAEEAKAVLAAGADLLHVDVMDNHYVPNLTFGPMFCEALRNEGITSPLDVHIMASPVESLINAFAKAGANSISVHPDATIHLDRTLQLITDLGCDAGIALNPATPLNVLDYVMDKISFILVMSVNPGFGGQAFISSTIHKITELKQKIATSSNPNIIIAVDGGVNSQNIAALYQAGAQRFIMGTAIFGHDNYESVIQDVHRRLL